MKTITIDIPEELDFMKNVSSKFWTAAVIEILKLKINKVAEIKRITSKSKATEKDVEELTENVKEAVWKQHSRLDVSGS